MTKIKLIGAVAILSAAIASPVLAQDEGVLGPGSRNGMTPRPELRITFAGIIIITMVTRISEG